MPPTPSQIEAGQAVYTPLTLRIYDLLVLGISNRFIWRCPTSRIEELYQQQVSGNHLDVGVGTGYFLDRCHFPTENPRVALMDLNENTLKYAAQRIARYHPETYRQNVFDPVETAIAPFDSLGMNYLLHCLPGAIGEKAVLFENLQPLLNPGATIFGSTILHKGVQRSWPARKLMDVYNRKGIFSNTNDTLDELKQTLQKRLVDVRIEVVGCVALFAGRHPG